MTWQWRQIRQLGWLECNRLAPRALDALPNLCSNLRSLNVFHLPTLADSTICALALSAGVSLRFLALHGCTSLTCGALVDRCTALRLFDVGAVPAVDYDSLDLIARCSLGAALRTVILSNCVGVSAASMHTLDEKFTWLMSLAMRAVSQLDDAGLADMCRGLGVRIQILHFTLRLLHLHGSVLPAGTPLPG